MKAKYQEHLQKTVCCYLWIS